MQDVTSTGNIEKFRSLQYKFAILRHYICGCILNSDPVDSYRTTLWYLWAEAAVHCSVTKSCLTLCDPVDCSTPVSSCFTVSLSLLKHISVESVMSSSVVPLSPCPQSLPASGSFPISQLFALGGQIIGASTSVFPLKIRVDFLYFFHLFLLVGG